MIRSLPFFVDTSSFTAIFVGKYRQKLAGGGVLPLRHFKDDDPFDIEDRALLKEWNSARSLLKRLRSQAAAVFDGKVPELGRVWIDHLPAEATTPWEREEGDYAEAIHRVRICMVPAPAAWTFSGATSAVLNVGIANLVDHRLPCSELNLSDTSRTHLVVDVMRPADGEDAA